MKKLLLLSLCLFTNKSFSQLSGIITYDERVKLNINFQGDAPAGLDLPKEQINKKTLIFTEDASLYFNSVNNTPTEIDQQTEGGMIKIRMDRPDEKSYVDIAGKNVVEERDLMTRKFLVTTDLTLNHWKLTGDQKEVAGYNCQKALLSDGERKVTAWFTNFIPVSSGPGRFAGLPGMILELTINDDITIAAISVEMKAIEKEKIHKPTDGKKVTWEEFNKIREEKMKEMEEENGGSGNGNVIIKIKK